MYVNRFWKYFIILIIFISPSFSLAEPAGEKSKVFNDPFKKRFLKLMDENSIYNATNKLKPAKDRIPKIIHQIWIGPNPLPRIYEPFIERCRNMPGFEHKLWTNADIEVLLKEKNYKETFDKIPAHDNAVKKDFLSYLILNKYGGVVMDASTWCRKAPSKIHDSYSYYTLYNSILSDNPSEQNPPNHVNLNSAQILASRKGGILIQDIIKRFEHFIGNYKEYNQKYTLFSEKDKKYYHGWLGQVVITEAIDKFCRDNKDCGSEVYLLTLKDYGQINSIMARGLDPYFVDGDQFYIAYYVKSFESKTADLDNLLGLKNNS